MARKKQADDGGSDAGAWLNTYADMVTLLLTFFILLFSMSSVDSVKFNMVVKAFADRAGTSEQLVIFSSGPIETEAVNHNLEEDANPLDLENLDEIFQLLSQYIQENNYAEKVEIAQSDEGDILIRFMDDMLFQPNSSKLKPEDLAILNFVGNGIKSIQDEVALIRIDGHTAAIPEVPDYPVSDRDLSSDRANEVLKHFEGTIGVDPIKLVSMGWGKHVPIADNSDLVGRSRNRRVEIYISSENPLKDELNNIYEKLRE